MDKYHIVRKIAEGRYGSVFLALLPSGERVAIKRIRALRLPGHDSWKNAEREADILRVVEHPHVVSLLDHVVTSTEVCLIFEHLAWDLSAALDQRCFDECQTRSVFKMLLLGVTALHARNIMHRDLKPANLLLGETGVLKIADFGSARFHRESEPLELLTREVCTRWYKSPEMLFGSVNYTVAVDLWAVGCVFGDMLSCVCRALFPGKSDIDQLCQIFAHVGIPQERDWPDVSRLPDFGKIEFLEREKKPFPFESCRSVASLRLLRSFLQLNPALRMSAAQSLEDDFFHAEFADLRSLVASLEERERTSVDRVSDEFLDFREFEPLSPGIPPGSVADEFFTENMGHATPPPPERGHVFKSSFTHA